MEEQTVMEYAVANRVSVSFVQKAITQGRLTARKSGKRWLIPAGAVIAPTGEKATEQVSPVDTGDKTEGAQVEQPTDEPSADMVALQDELNRREAAVRLGEEKVTRLIALFESDESALADERRSLDDYKDKLIGWMDDAKERAMAVGDAVTQLKENRYEVQVPVGGNSYKTVTRYRQLERYQVENLLSVIADGLMAIINLETPRWIKPREVQEDADQYDDGELFEDEQEPDEVDQDAILEQVEQQVDRDLPEVEATPEIITKKQGKKVVEQDEE